MAKITAIKQQVKRKDRYSIYVDGKYAFSFSENELIKSELKKGQTLAPKDLKRLKAEAVIDKAYDRVLRYISIRPRSQWELTDYLKRKGYEPEIAEVVMAKIKPLGLIDDLAFARQWVAWRLHGRLRSKRQLQAELIKKRIDREIIAEVLADVDNQTQLEQIKAIIERKAKLSQYQERQKLISYLARQGFPYQLIKRALESEEV